MRMANKKAISLRCPTCRGLVLAGSEDFPFCSDRCRLIDLGKWASEGYRISTPITDPEMLESLLEEKQRSQSQSEDEHNSGKH
ncbi:MAG TPA: DNA gyrase inhibitor YacG [Candidatus Angelobacter sp.]|nr:DNA gyrase inhibitor YacG [Candidatus Angelobacter sp.]